MTDREMLLMAYGALRIAVEDGVGALAPVTNLITDHLYADKRPAYPTGLLEKRIIEAEHEARKVKTGPDIRGSEL